MFQIALAQLGASVGPPHPPAGPMPTTPMRLPTKTPVKPPTSVTPPKPPAKPPTPPPPKPALSQPSSSRHRRCRNPNRRKSNLPPRRRRKAKPISAPPRPISKCQNRPKHTQETHGRNQRNAATREAARRQPQETTRRTPAGSVQKRNRCRERSRQRLQATATSAQPRRRHEKVPLGDVINKRPATPSAYPAAIPITAPCGTSTSGKQATLPSRSNTLAKRKSISTSSRPSSAKPSSTSTKPKTQPPTRRGNSNTGCKAQTFNTLVTGRIMS